MGIAAYSEYINIHIFKCTTIAAMQLLYVTLPANISLLIRQAKLQHATAHFGTFASAQNLDTKPTCKRAKILPTHINTSAVNGRTQPHVLRFDLLTENVLTLTDHN